MTPKIVVSRASAVQDRAFRAAVIGITASGKSTLANELVTRLRQLGASAEEGG